MHPPSLRVVLRRLIPSILAAVAVLAGGLTLGSSVASAETQWSDGPSFGGDTKISSAAVVVGDAAGGVTAAWGIDGSSSTRATVVAQRTAADGTRGPLVQLGYTKWSGPLALGALPNIAPIRVAATAAGAVVLWQDPGAEDPQSERYTLRFARIGSDGSAGPAQTVVGDVRQPTVPTLAPALAANAAGDVLISWWNGSTGEGPHVQHFAGDNTPGPVNDLPNAYTNQSDLALPVAMLADGTGRIAYTSANRRLAVGRIEPSGLLGTPVPVQVTPTDVVGAPLMASGDGVAAITWGEGTATGVTLRSALLPSTGDVATAPRTVTTGLPFIFNPTGISLGVAVAVKSDDTIVNAWVSPGVDLTAPGADLKNAKLIVGTLAPADAVASTRPLDGTPYVTEGTIAIAPAISANPNGSIGLAWLEGRSSLYTSPPTTVDDVQNLYRVRATTIEADGTLNSPRGPSPVRFVSAAEPLLFASTSGGRTLIGWTGVGGLGVEIKTAFDTAIIPPPPPVPAPVVVPPPPPGPVAPTLSLVRFSEKSIVPGDKATFVLTSSQAGLVKIAITKATDGRKVAGKCVAQTKKNKKKAKCKFDKAITTIAKSYAAGRTSIAFNGKVGKKKLAVGTYKATITVTATTGLVSAPTVLTFKVKQAKKKTTKR